MKNSYTKDAIKDAINQGYAWPGGYPLVFVTKDGGCLCAKCAKENIVLCTGPDEEGYSDPQWRVDAYDINYEDTSLYCDNCNALIESAYGEATNEEEGE
jgi:hypothetical protein